MFLGDTEQLGSAGVNINRGILDKKRILKLLAIWEMPFIFKFGRWTKMDGLFRLVDAN